MGRRKKASVAVKEQITRLPIPCKPRATQEYGTILPEWNPEQKRLGRYSSTTYPGVEKKRYAVLMRVDGDFEEFIQQGMSDDEITEGCIEFLNTPPPRKKYAKKTPQPLYGKLKLLRCEKKYNEDGTLSYTLIVTTNNFKNKHFWGQGYRCGK